MGTSIRRVLAVAVLWSLPLMVFAQDNAGTPSDSDRAARREKFVEKMKTTDANGDHLISKDEMSKGMPRLSAHFDEIDTSHDGKVSPEELKAYMQSHKGKRRKGGGR